MAGINRSNPVSSSGSFGDSPNLTAEDIFHRFFRRESNQKFNTSASEVKKGENVVQQIDISLVETFNGAQKNISVSRDRPCMACDNGMNVGRSNLQEGDPCVDCRGTGMRQTVKQMGPSIVNHVSSPCSSCEGRGIKVQQNSRCRVCNGTMTTKERTILSVRVDPGTLDGAKLCFRGEGALPSKNAIPGDVILVVKTTPHDTYRRSGNDLSMTVQLSLAECLCGYERDIPHLDGSILKLMSSPGAVTKPNSVFFMADKGMPVPALNQRGTFRGRLFVKFDVQFPDSLPADVIGVLGKVLPQSSSPPSSRRMSIGGEDDLGPGTESAGSQPRPVQRPRAPSPNTLIRRDSQSVLWNTSPYSSPRQSWSESVGEGEGVSGFAGSSGNLQQQQGTPLPEQEQGSPQLQPFTPRQHEPYGAYMKKELKSHAYNIQNATSDVSDSEYGSPSAGCGQQ